MQALHAADKEPSTASDIDADDPKTPGAHAVINPKQRSRKGTKRCHAFAACNSQTCDDASFHEPATLQYLNPWKPVATQDGDTREDVVAPDLAQRAHTIHLKGESKQNKTRSQKQMP